MSACSLVLTEMAFAVLEVTECGAISAPIVFLSPHSKQCSEAIVVFHKKQSPERDEDTMN